MAPTDLISILKVKNDAAINTNILLFSVSFKSIIKNHDIKAFVPINL